MIFKNEKWRFGSRSRYLELQFQDIHIWDNATWSKVRPIFTLLWSTLRLLEFLLLFSSAGVNACSKLNGGEMVEIVTYCGQWHASKYFLKQRLQALRAGKENRNPLENKGHAQMINIYLRPENKELQTKKEQEKSILW